MAKKQCNVLSIDWDYYADATAMQRFTMFPDGGNETISYSLSNLIWNHRYESDNELKNIPLREQEYILTKRLFSKINGGARILLTDSHEHIYDFILNNSNDKVNIFNIDFHHDLYGIDKELTCGNWFSKLINEGKVNFGMWVKHETSEIPKVDYGVQMTTDIKKLMHKKYDLVFICKSSIWSPPHLDNKFRELINILQFHTGVEVPYDNPLTKEREIDCLK